MNIGISNPPLFWDIFYRWSKSVKIIKESQIIKSNFQAMVAMDL